MRDPESTITYSKVLCIRFYQGLSPGRDQEVQSACWSDFDFESKIFSVTEKLDLGFSPSSPWWKS